MFSRDGVLLETWSLGGISLESIATDQERGLVFVVDRTNRLIKAFQLDGTFVQDFGAGLFHTDVEDVDVYRCGADGYILVSDQDADRFEIFDRVTLQPLARFRISGVADTDGLAIVRHPLPGYPYGAIFVQSDNRNVHGLGWERLAAATGMATCLP